MGKKKMYKKWEKVEGSETIIHGCEKVFRIKCIKPFGNVLLGQEGGVVGERVTLWDDAWVEYNSMCLGKSVIVGYATIKGKSWVTDTKMWGESIIKDALVNKCVLMGTSIIEKSSIKGLKFVDGTIKNIIMNGVYK